MSPATPGCQPGVVAAAVCLAPIWAVTERRISSVIVVTGLLWGTVWATRTASAWPGEPADLVDPKSGSGRGLLIPGFDRPARRRR